MKNNVLKLFKYLYYLSLMALLLLYLFPGSLIGFFLYGDLGKQPTLISNHIGTSINHLIFFFYLSILSFIINTSHKGLIFSFPFLFGISILLELLHLIVPNRAFEFMDLFANSAGVVIALLLFNLIKKIRI